MAYKTYRQALGSSILVMQLVTVSIELKVLKHDLIICTMFSELS
jgi:hypothetical protein